MARRPHVTTEGLGAWDRTRATFLGTSPSRAPYRDPMPPMTDPIDVRGLGLPDLPGGWSLEAYPIHDDVDIELYVPVEPDALLDDTEVQERNRYNDAMPYWAWIWDSAPRLARQISGDLHGRSGPISILEVGAGLGFAGLGVAAALGPRAEVLLTDHDPAAVQALGVQIDRNRPVRARASALDWNKPRALEDQRFDVIIGCDVIYEARSHEPLLALLGAHLASDGVAWFGDPGRTRAPGFVRRAEGAGFTVATLDAGGEARPLEAGQYRAIRLAAGG